MVTLLALSILHWEEELYAQLGVREEFSLLTIRSPAPMSPILCPPEIFGSETKLTHASSKEIHDSRDFEGKI